MPPRERDLLSGRETYAIVACVFQLGLAALVFPGPGRRRVRAALALVLVANAYEVAEGPILLGFGILPPSWDAFGGHVLDPAIGISLAFIMSQLPTPLGGSRGANVATGLWVGGLAASTIIILILRMGLPATSPQIDAIRILQHALPFAIAAFLLAAHVVPRWCQLPRGPLRGQVLLFASGLGIGFAATGLNNVIDLIDGGAKSPVAASYSLPFWFSLAAMLRLLVPRPSPDGLLFAGILASSAAFAIADRMGAESVGEFGVQAVRPALVAFAILRYDLVDVGRASRSVLLPVTGVAFALTLFFGLHAILSGGFDPLSAPAAALSLSSITLGTMLARRPLVQVLRGSGGEAGSLERIESYRLALEAAGPPFVSRDLVGLRSRLRITDEEHDTLVAILKSHVVVPTRAVRGLQAGETVSGRYDVVRELGRGGQGRALLARDGTSGGLVVLKEIARPWEEGARERLEALRREADAGARVRSPRVARVLGIVEDAGIAYLVREYAPGRTLDAIVSDQGPFPEARALATVKDILDGLATIHDAGLLHLDLKPSNIVADESGRAVIIDLGTARRVAVAGSTLTQGVAPGGTLGWMAPEQAAGESVGPPADVYGAGALLAFLLTGRKPTPAGFAAPEGALGEVVRRACAADPRARFASAAEMAVGLRSP